MSQAFLIQKSSIDDITLNSDLMQIETTLTNKANKSDLIGAIFFFAATTPPAGFFKANGGAVGREEYPELFVIIGTTFGNGDGVSTFNLPDLRGEFIRCWSDGSGIDGGREFGSKQGDTIRNITGSFIIRPALSSSNNAVSDAYGTGVFTHIPSEMDINNSPYASQGSGAGRSKDVIFDASRVVPTAAENRPRNIALLACIKY